MNIKSISRGGHQKSIYGVKINVYEKDLDNLESNYNEVFEMLKNTYAFVKSNPVLEIDPEWIKKYSNILSKLEGVKYEAYNR